MNHNNYHNQSGKKTYFNQSVTMTEHQALEKIAMINQMNNTNNEMLSTMKLGYGFYQSKFPSKLSQDLNDIYTTSMIQSNLIKQIKRLNQSLTQLQSRTSNQLNYKQLQLQRQKQRNSQLQKQLRTQKTHLAKLQTYEQKIKHHQFTIIQLQKKCLSLQSKQTHYKNQIKRLQSMLGNMRNELSQFRKQTWTKNITIIDQVCNSLHNQVVVKNDNQLRNSVELGDMKGRVRVLEKQNEKYLQWVKRFVDSIERILQIKLKKLRQSAATEQQIHTAFKHLPKMHIKMMPHFCSLTQFPYAAMLHDFQFIVNQAQLIKIQLAQYHQLSNTQQLNKQLVQMVITQMRQCKAKIIQEFRQCGERRQQIANQYENLMDYDQHVVDLVSNVTLERLRNFQQHPQRLLREIEGELIDVRKHKEFVQNALVPKKPQLLTKRLGLHDIMKKSLNQFKDHQKRKQFKQLHIKQLQQQDQQQQKQILKTETQTEQEYCIRRYNQSKQFVLQQLSKKSFREERQQMLQMVRAEKDVQGVKNLYVEMFMSRKPESKSQAMITKALYKQKKQQVLKMQMQTPTINNNNFNYLPTGNSQFNQSTIQFPNPFQNRKNQQQQISPFNSINVVNKPNTYAHEANKQWEI